MRNFSDAVIGWYGVSVGDVRKFGMIQKMRLDSGSDWGVQGRRGLLTKERGRSRES